MSMSGMTPPAIEFDDVRFRYDRGAPEMAFDAMIPAGSITAVMGPSGSGKSTLFALLAGFEQPQRGEIRIGTIDITRLAPAERPISVVFQDNNLFAHLDVAANIALGQGAREAKTTAGKEQVSDALARVGLGGFERRRPASLSGGERQRVAMARALVRAKPVLLLDEPFAALGPGLREDMRALIANLHVQNALTTLIITHQPEDSRAICDRILYVEQGSIRANEPTESMFRRADIAGWRDYLGTN
jgi:thiamine transport system ATP-binding protein